MLTGGNVSKLGPDLDGGFYIQPTIFKGHNKMRVFQEEIFGPVISATTFKTQDEAIEIANDTQYGLGAGVWTRDAHELYEIPRAIQAGRVWVNCYHHYPAHAVSPTQKLVNSMFCLVLLLFLVCSLLVDTKNPGLVARLTR